MSPSPHDRTPDSSSSTSPPARAPQHRAAQRRAPSRHRPAWLPRLPWLLVGTDALLVTIFAVLGNRTHLSGLALTDIFATGAPFLAALGLGWAVTRSWRRPSRIWPDGLIIVASTVTVGMILRVLLDLGGAPLSFVLVTMGVLSTFLLGRRAITGVLLPQTRD